MKMFLVLVIIGASVAALVRAADTAPAAMSTAHPRISAQVMFLYYKDLAAGEHFYGDILALKKTYDQDWVKLFQLTEHSYVGLVDEKHGTHAAPDTTPSVMLSVETDDLEGWYERLKARGVTFQKELDLNSKQPLVNSILMKDPAGYTVEFYRWRAHR
jgi:extradiol dioxygenase family protein